MPLLLIWAAVAVLGLYVVAAPDRATLGLTRGAAGAVRASIGSGGRTRSAPRSTRPDRVRSTRGSGSTPTRSTGRPARSKKADPPDRPTPVRSTSRIARAINGWIDGAEGAERRRGEAAAAVRRLRDRARDRKAAKQVAAVEDQAWDENERRDRAEQRARSSAGAQDIAKQYDPPTPPAPPAAPNGAAVPDFIRPTTTELDTLDQAAAEVRATFAAVDQIADAIAEISSWISHFPERYRGATDLWKTDPMNASVDLLGEVQIADMQTRFGDLATELHQLLKNIEKARNDVNESDAKSGRVETAIPS